MKKKTMALFLSVAMIMGTVVGCGGGSDTPADNGSAGEVKNPEDVSGKVVFVSGNDTTGGVDEMIKAFNEKYPNIEVEKQVLPGNSDDVKKSLMTSLAAGDSEPDVFECDIIWVSQFAAAGWLLDVTENLEAKKDEYLQVHYPHAITMIKLMLIRTIQMSVFFIIEQILLIKRRQRGTNLCR